MKSGKCPKCSKKTVYSSRMGITFHANSAMYILNLKEVMIMPMKDYTDYVCTSCGYFETYIDDPAKLEKIAGLWQKV